MKITKSYLKQVIKEELNSLEEAPMLRNDVIKFIVNHNDSSITATLNDKKLSGIPKNLELEIRTLLLNRPRD